jgi:hypothetical protein
MDPDAATAAPADADDTRDDGRAFRPAPAGNPRGRPGPAATARWAWPGARRGRRGRGGDGGPRAGPRARRPAPPVARGVSRRERRHRDRGRDRRRVVPRLRDGEAGGAGAADPDASPEPATSTVSRIQATEGLITRLEGELAEVDAARAQARETRGAHALAAAEGDAAAVAALRAASHDAARLEVGRENVDMALAAARTRLADPGGRAPGRGARGAAPEERRAVPRAGGAGRPDRRAARRGWARWSRNGRGSATCSTSRA